MVQFPPKFMINGTILILIKSISLFLDGDVPWRTSYGVNISQLIRFGRASSNLRDFYCRNKAHTAKLLRLGYHFKLRKAFSKFYRRRRSETLLQQCISEPEFYGDT